MTLLNGFKIKKNNNFSKFIMAVALVFLIFSEVAYMRTSYSPVSIFLLVVIPLSMVWTLQFKGLSVSPLIIVSYIFCLILALYTIIGIAAYSRASLGIQFFSSLLSAYLFLNIGFYGDKKRIAQILFAALCVVFVFSASQFLYFTLNFFGPYSAFKEISRFVIEMQNDFSVENIYGRSSGIFTSPNTLGFFSGIAFWIIIYLRSQLSKAVLVSSVMLCFFCMLLSISRGSIFSLIFSLFFFFAFGGGWKGMGRGKLFLSLFIFIFALLFSGTIINSLTEGQVQRFSEIFYVIDGDYSKSDNLLSRVEAWSSIARYIESYPFGTILPPQLVINESPDNQFIYYFAQGGIVLLLASIAFYSIIFYYTITSSSRDRYVFAAATFFVIINCITSAVMNGYIYMLFFMMIGLFSRDRLRV